MSDAILIDIYSFIKFPSFSNVLEEIEQIKEEQAEKQQNEISKQEQLAKFSRQGNQPVK